MEPDEASSNTTEYTLTQALSRAGSIETDQEIWSNIHHPNILLPHAFGISSSGDPMIVSQYADYGDLGEILKKKLTLQRRVRMAIEVACGVIPIFPWGSQAPCMCNVGLHQCCPLAAGDPGLQQYLQPTPS
jgi:hypothetical protein